MDKCPYCGAETRPGDNFCLNCGNRLPPATPSFQQATPLSGDASLPGSDHWGAPIAPAVNVRMRAESATVQAMLGKVENPAHFIIRDEKGDVLQEYRLEKSETVIGRAPSSDILLSKDKLTSRRHAVVRYENGDYVISDERSANGTFVNGQQLEELTPRTLKDGDHVGIGEHELIFHISASAGVPDSLGTQPQAQQPQPGAWESQDLPLLRSGCQPLWAAAPSSAAKDPWGQPASQQPGTVRVSSQPAPTSYGGGQAWGQTAQPADPWAKPSPQQPQPAQQGGWPQSLQQQSPNPFPAASDPATSPWQQQGTPGKKVLSLFSIARTTLEEDDRAIVRKVYFVEAGISQSKPEGFEGEPFKLPLLSSIRFLFLDILLHTSSNIELISHWQRRLRYDSHNPEPQLVAFKFKVMAPGSCFLAIDFYYERRWLRTIHFEFNAVEQSQLTAISSEG